jgi:ATP-dependent Clp protease ATP-binding subunit ClpC
VADTDTLDEGRDLTALAGSGKLLRPLCREAEAQSLVELLKRGSVLVTGAEGVGKSSVIQAAAHELLRRADGRRIVEWSTALIMSGTKYIGEWQTRVSELAEQAEAAGAILYVTDLVNIATVGMTSNTTSSLLDALRPFLSSGRLKLLGEATPAVVFRMQQIPGFMALFTELPVRPLGDAEADRVVKASAGEEKLRDDAFLALRDLTARFLPARPRPGPELLLLSRVLGYATEKRAVGEPPMLDAGFIEHVFAIYSGLPKFVVSPREAMPARDIRAFFRQHIVGQEAATEAVVESIALYKAGLHDPTRPIGTFLFVGPTGVGKTELARSLSRFMFGSDARLLRFDMSEFKDYHAFEMLLGNPREPGRPARLLDPVRAQPFQVVLLDEIEKGHANVYDLLLQVLDEGRLTSPGGDAVSFRNTFFIVTSNVGASAEHKSLGFGHESRAGGGGDMRRVLEQEFRPELLNRFQHIVRFEALSKEQVHTIARKELGSVLSREGIARRNLVVEVSDEALELALERGYDPRYGARALKRELQRTIVLPLAMTLMERPVEAGALLRVVAEHGSVRVRALDTPESRSARSERAPVKLDEQRKVSRDELDLELRNVGKRLVELARELDVPARLRRQKELLELRTDPGLYKRSDEASRVLRDLERVSRVLSRMERLEERNQELWSDLSAARLRSDLERAARAVSGLRMAVEAARRELVLMGEDGEWDAVVSIRPVGAGGRKARDLLHEIYGGWAGRREATVTCLHEPLADDEPVTLLIEGSYAHGFLRLESGLHRLRNEDDTSVARVQVWPFNDARVAPPFGAQAALKATGQLGGRVRSRLVCSGLVLQNARTLAENRELAMAHYGPFLAAPPSGDDIVRRYDRNPTLVRDTLLELSTGRWDVLGPEGFHELLEKRVEAAGRLAP